MNNPWFNPSLNHEILLLNIPNISKPRRDFAPGCGVRAPPAPPPGPPGLPPGPPGLPPGPPGPPGLGGLGSCHLGLGSVPQLVGFFWVFEADVSVRHGMMVPQLETKNSWIFSGLKPINHPALVWGLSDCMFV